VRPHVPAIGVLTALCVAATAACGTTNSPRATTTDTGRDRPQVHGVASASPSQAAGAQMRPIRGALITDVTRQLSSRWGVNFADDGYRIYVTTVTPPGTGRQMKITVEHASGDTGDAVGAVQCTMIQQPDLAVDRAVLADVTSCLTPLLRGPEQQTVAAWLEANALSLPPNTGRNNDFDTVHVNIDHQGRAVFYVRISGRS
jgi:hypothetical protein